jgi:hypothetical protein
MSCQDCGWETTARVSSDLLCSPPWSLRAVWRGVSPASAHETSWCLLRSIWDTGRDGGPHSAYSEDGILSSMIVHYTTLFPLSYNKQLSSSIKERT